MIIRVFIFLFSFRLDTIANTTDNFDMVALFVLWQLLHLNTKSLLAGSHSSIANAIASHYNILPENVRSILFQLVDNPYSDKSVANSIMSNFDNLYEEIRNKFLFELSEYIYRHKGFKYYKNSL